MKLNTKRTLLIGLAFFSICAFWQMYDTIIPLILRDTFRIGDSLSGAIMAADNVLALVLLPLFGKLSDRTDTRLGRRTPFILGGTSAAVALRISIRASTAESIFFFFFSSLFCGTPDAAVLYHIFATFSLRTQECSTKSLHAAAA